MLNKELLGEILNENITNIKKHLNNKDIVVIYFIKKDSEYTFKMTLDIHNISNKCKEWAWKEYHQVIASMIDEKTARTPNEKTQWYASCTSYYEASLDGVYTDEEQEAVFVITEWIYKNCKKMK